MAPVLEPEVTGTSHTGPLGVVPPPVPRAGPQPRHGCWLSRPGRGECWRQLSGCKFSPRAPRSHRAEAPAWGTGEEMAETGKESLAEVVEGARQEA